MTPEHLLRALIDAESFAEADLVVKEFVEINQRRVSWLPVGGRPNNRGVIEVSADPGRSLVERLTNAVDAVLEAEHEIHNGQPVCSSPMQAALAWLNVPTGGLVAMAPGDRRVLSALCTIRLLPGDGRDLRIVEIRDEGIGLSAEEMPRTILSLNESNKIEKRYLAGTYGQGGSSTFAISKLTLIASRHYSTDAVAFSLVRYEDLPAERWKTGNYVYLAVDDGVLACRPIHEDFRRGTLVKHFGYDLSTYPSPVGPRSVYGLLNRVLFDPILPVWLDNQIHRYRRVIKGSRNALNGAVDEGDEETRGPALVHRVRLYFVTLAEFGRIGIEYWVLELPTKAKRRPSEAFVNPSKPIVLTQNGQNHAELSQLLVRKAAELPYLAQRLICHIDCNSLTPEAKRALFVSSREDARSGVVRDLIEAELVKTFRADDELRRLNEEAKLLGRRERDEESTKRLKQEVARLLRIHGLNLPQEGSSSGEGDLPKARRSGRRGPRVPPPTIELHEPPTYLRIVWGDDVMEFHNGQRRHLRIETDAGSSYHDPSNPHASHINFIIVGAAVRVCGSTPLERGRMRVVIECPPGITIGDTGSFRVELQRPGLPMLEDQRTIRIVAEPRQRAGPSKVAVPPFEVRPVAPEDPLWTTLGWPESPDIVASEALMEAGTLIIHYSTAFPGFERQHETWERKDPTLAESFTRRYEVWLAVHSLLYYQDEQKRVEEEGSAQIEPEQERLFEQAERRRMATVASFVAGSEVSSGDPVFSSLPDDV